MVKSVVAIFLSNQLELSTIDGPRVRFPANAIVPLFFLLLIDLNDGGDIIKMVVVRRVQLDRYKACGV